HEVMSDLSKRIAALSAAQRAIFERRLQQQGLSLPTTLPAIQRRAVSAEPPLSFAQERLWFLDQFAPESPVYNGPSALRLSGPLDTGALKRSLDEMARRHESLRTTFVPVEGRPVQRIAPVGAQHAAPLLALPLVDLRALPDDMREAVALRIVRAEAARPFDLARGPLARALLLRLDTADQIMLFTMHHIISDGWSTELLAQEVAALYEAFATGRPSPLPELPIQYADFA